MPWRATIPPDHHHKGTTMEYYLCDNCNGHHEGTFSHVCEYTGDDVMEVVCPLDGLASLIYRWASI